MIYTFIQRLYIAKMKTIGGKNGSRQYVLQSVLGQGSFGKVYYSPPYAVKEVTLNVQSFVRQAIKNQTGILRQLNHPNIVRLLDIVEEGSSLFMVMEFCEEDLSQYLRKNRLEESKAIEVIKQVAAGLSCLVEKGVIHRDLKPANILVNSRGEFKLADFGLARYVQQYDSSLLQTIAGTPLYMAPQILRKSPYTTKCDIWSAGIIFYELLTGKLPWNASSQRELYINITTKPLVIPITLSQWSKKLLIRMLVVSENDRIGWEQLFEHIRQHEGSRGKKGKERPSSATKSETNVCEKSPLKVNKETISYPASKLKDLLQLDLSECLPEWTCNKIMKDPSYKPTLQQIEKIKQVLATYCPQLITWYKKEFNCIKDIALP